MSYGTLVGHLPGGLAQVNVVSNLIFSGMSGSAVADASGPGLIVARMMAENGRYPVSVLAGPPLRVCGEDLVAAAVLDLRAGIPVGRISAR